MDINKYSACKICSFLITCLLLTTLVSGSPLQNKERRKRNPSITMTLETNDDWDVTLGHTVYKTVEKPIWEPTNKSSILSNDQLENIYFAGLKRNYTQILKEIDNNIVTTQQSSFFSQILKIFNLGTVEELGTTVFSGLTCTACRAGAGFLLHNIHAGKSDSEIVGMINTYCTNLNIQTPEVCKGISQLFGVEVIYVLSRITLSPLEICSMVMGDECEDVYSPLHEWTVPLPPLPKPKLASPQPPKPGQPTFKVLQLSDLHYDPYYLEGSNADCRNPLCCRLSNGMAANKESAAGRWGDYRKCDTPRRTIDHMLHHITSTHPDIDYILWTGDLPPHDIWNQTREENKMILKETTSQLTQFFPGVPVFPALGNHESVPVNSFPPPFVSGNQSISWLYDEIDKQWQQWLPDSISKTVRRGAFYSILVRPGFRIISLNTNYCSNKNWWLMLNSVDPAKELEWFVYELQSAELNNEKVHIIGHIPTGHVDCMKIWSRNYYRIINRYEGIITAQFFGHTHYDEFEIYYDTQNLERAISISYIGPSVSPYIDLNPGYRIYYIDGDHNQTTRQVVDHETWVMNLQEANKKNYPIWYKLYSAREAYDMPSLLPQEWDKLWQRLATNPQLFNLYYMYYWKNSPVRPKCNADCRKQMLCDLRSGKTHDRKLLCSKLV